MKIKRGLKFNIVLVLLLATMLFTVSCGKQEIDSSDLEENSSLATDLATEGEAFSENEEEGPRYYSISFEGGSGKAYIESPVEVTFDGSDITACFIWSSKNYDYMIVDDVRYDNENEGGPSTFHVKIKNLDEPLKVIGDTTAMSKPHEIEYVITWLEEIPGNGIGTEGDASISSNEVDKADVEETENKDIKVSESRNFDPVEIKDQEPLGEEKLSYAECFRIIDYKDFKLVQIKNSGNYIVLDEGAKEPEITSGEAVILRKPLDKTYLVSTSVMDFIQELDTMENIRLSGLKSDEWYISEAADAMEKGEILYAGKYRAPDYELILSEGCNLAIENTMIYHNPEVKEKLEDLGIPVLVEMSSYESHPLGRLEWIKLYGILYDKEEEAETYYNEQLAAVEPILKKDETDLQAPQTSQNPQNLQNLKVVFFYVTASGAVNVRVPGDYITEMIELSGGDYIFPGEAVSDSDNETMKSSVNVQAEDFYVAAKDADIIIYNSTIGGELKSLNDFTEKNELFKDFKAVKEGNVYSTEADFFQKTTGMGDFIEDLNTVFTGGDDPLTYLNKLD